MFAPSALGILTVLIPGPLAQAFTFRAFGAFSCALHNLLRPNYTCNRCFPSGEPGLSNSDEGFNHFFTGHSIKQLKPSS